MKHYQTQDEIESLIVRFHSKDTEKLPFSHQAHLTVGLWFAYNYEVYDATCRVRSGIIAFNLAAGGANTGTSGYHETLTVFWMQVIFFFRRLNEGQGLLDFVNAFLDSPFADKTLPFRFYDRQVIESGLARAQFVGCDRFNEIAHGLISNSPGCAPAADG